MTGVYRGTYVLASIVRWVDDEPQPGLVQCEFEDASGRRQVFVEKYVYFTGANLMASSAYPQSGYIQCDVVAHRDDSGVELVDINTDMHGLGMESINGTSHFTVPKHLLISGEEINRSLGKVN